MEMWTMFLAASVLIDLTVVVLLLVITRVEKAIQQQVSDAFAQISNLTVLQGPMYTVQDLTYMRLVMDEWQNRNKKALIYGVGLTTSIKGLIMMAVLQFVALFLPNIISLIRILVHL